MKRIVTTAYTSVGSNYSFRQTHQVEHSEKSVDGVEMWLEQILPVYLTTNIHKKILKSARRERERDIIQTFSLMQQSRSFRAAEMSW